MNWPSCNCTHFKQPKKGFHWGSNQWFQQYQSSTLPTELWSNIVLNLEIQFIGHIIPTEEEQILWQVVSTEVESNDIMNWRIFTIIDECCPAAQFLEL